MPRKEERRHEWAEGGGGRMGDVAFRVSLSSTHTTPPQPLTRLPQINAPEFQLRPAKVAEDPCNVGAGEKKRQREERSL